MTETFSTGQLISFSEQRGTLRYKLAPYGEKARDRDATFAAGSINFSDAEGAIVNVEHDQFRPIGKLSNFESKPDGLYVTVTLADTTLGRDTFTEAKEGLRTGISMELSAMSPATGLIESATLSGAGICVNPALGSARLIQAFSEDEIKAAAQEALTGISASLDALDAALVKASEAPAEEDSNESPAVPEEIEESSEEEDPKNGFNMNENAVPTALSTPTTPKVTLSAASLIQASKDAKFRSDLIESGQAGDNDNMFSLAPVTSTAHTDNISVPQFLGELWGNTDYKRKYAPLVSSGSLTSWKVEGYKFVGEALVDTYAGDLAEVPTNAPTTVSFSAEAVRCAHAFKVDRKFRDFSDSSFLQSLLQKQTDGYAKLSDRRVFNHIKAAATANPVEASAPVAGIAEGLTRIVDGALAVLDELDVMPTFALVSNDLYREMLLTTEFDNLKFISTSLGLEEGAVSGLQIVPSKELPAKTVIVGHSSAIQFFELAGSPIRVEAIDVAHGGYDEGIFGYTLLLTHEAAGIVEVTPFVP